MKLSRLLRPALAAAALALLATPAASQTVQPRITVGTNPVSVAVNPMTNKVYVANAGSNNLTIVNGGTGTPIATLPMPAYPAWVAVDAEANRIYVSALTGANTTIVDGASNAVITTLASGGGGWTAVNPINDAVYVMRYGAGDEVNMIQNELYVGTSRSYGPIGIAVNPVNNWVYVVNQATGDVAVLDMTTYDPYPALKCPDGAGGFKPQPPVPPPGGPDPWPGCINVPDTPVAVAVNPVTNKIYAVSSGTSNQISVINGVNSTFVSLTPTGGLTGGKAIAVNPVTNKVYVAFGNGVVVLNGADNTMTTLPIASGNPVAIGVNVLTNKVYVPKNDGTLLAIDGATNVATPVGGLTAGANAIAVNPLTNTIYVTDSGGGVTPVQSPIGEATIAVGITTTITPLPGNTSGSGSGTITLNATSAMTPAPLGTVRSVYFRIDGGSWSAAAGTGPWTATFSGLAPGNHTLQAFATNGLEAPSINTDIQNVPILGNVAAYAFTVSAPPAPQLGLSVASIDFGGQSMGTTSPSQAVTVTNTGNSTLNVTGITVGAQFGQTNNCSSPLSAGTGCTVLVTFSPAVAAGPINSTTAVTGALTITSNASGSPHQVSLAGTGEKSLVTHYYRAILRRAADSGGKTFWGNEAARVVGLGADVNEAWYALAQFFFSSAEYAAFNRNNDAFVTDLYNTFFNRAPDAGGLSFWSGQLSSGLPREVLLAAFMFSSEFKAFSQAIFGNAGVRAEIDAVTDFYRGLLARLPDDGGFNYWVGQFRTAQCQGSGAVYAQVESISSAFATGAEYTARARTNAQYVGDLYNAFLRRGGDLQGVQYWIDQLNTGARTRENVRRAFIATPEFSARVNAIVNQGCAS